jgi:osmoprotectant transport system ATP-binding protein
MLRLQGVQKRYGDVEALRSIDLGFATGSVTAVIGPSGCGKSTLLKLLNGLVEPDRGAVLFDEAKVTPATAAALRRRMGYVIQEGGLFPHLTARENVTLMARHLGWPRARIAARTDELTELARLAAERLDEYPARLSGGQRQRVGLMRALMLDPEVLLLDEPLGALDPMVRAELQTDLRRIFSRLGKTVVMVTHDLGEAGYLADRVVLMRDGAIVQVGPLGQLLEAPADEFARRFVSAQRAAHDVLV